MRVQCLTAQDYNVYTVFRVYHKYLTNTPEPNTCTVRGMTIRFNIIQPLNAPSQIPLSVEEGLN